MTKQSLLDLDGPFAPNPGQRSVARRFQTCIVGLQEGVKSFADAFAALLNAVQVSRKKA
jgi:hypothetical protein